MEVRASVRLYFEFVLVDSLESVTGSAKGKAKAKRDERKCREC